MSRSGRVLVTGGGGFLGSHLCESFLADGYDVIALDNFTSGRRSNLSDINGALTVSEHDVRQPIKVDGPIDAIYHLASRASPVEFEDHAIEIAETNAFGSRNVLELAADHDATVVLASTSEVYGDPEVHPQLEAYNGNVSPRGPRAAYDESKRFMEALGTAFHHKRGLDVRTVRIFNTYGPRMRPDDGRVIPTFISQALAGDPLTLHGTGNQTRCFCYVDDLIRGIRRVGATPDLTGDVLNLGATREIAIKKLASAILRLTDSDSLIKHVERPTDDPEIRRPDISRARERIDWEPSVDLETGLDRTVRYFEQLREVQPA